MLPSYSRLKVIKKEEDISYKDMLTTLEWHTKRNEILLRDNHRCKKCKLSATGPHVHYDESKKEYSYISDDGTDHLQYVKNSEGQIVPESIPRTIITNKPYHLEVHHKYYILNKLPWEYNESALVALCNWCHSEIHTNETILVYQNESLIDFEELIPCNRCNGTGFIPEYSHVQGGICFECHGNRFKNSLYTIKSNK
jgi:hypothetical protein